MTIKRIDSVHDDESVQFSRMDNSDNEIEEVDDCEFENLGSDSEGSAWEHQMQFNAKKYMDSNDVYLNLDKNGGSCQKQQHN